MCQLLEGSEPKGVGILNNRQRMYVTNRMVRDWLLEKGYDQIWFKRHTKRNDIVFTQKGNYLATDLWNLFDGICLSKFGDITFLQMKTNAWAKESDLMKFIKKNKNVMVLVFNVTNKLRNTRGYVIRTRFYDDNGRLEI